MSFDTVRKLKVLQLCHDYKGPFPSICRQYCEAFSDADVTTIYIKGKPDDAITGRTGGTKVIYFDSSSKAMRGLKISILSRLLLVFRKINFDIVVAHRYKPIYLAGMISFFSRSLLILGVVHEHDVFSRPARALFLTFWRRGIHVVAVSKSVAKNIVQACPSLLTGKRLHVLGHALSKDTILLKRLSARGKLGLEPDHFVFGAVGRLIRKKQFDVLLRAFAAAKLDERCTLVIVGDGPEASRLSCLAESLNILHRVFFFGHLDQAVQYFKAFDCFVMPSSDAEAFGIVLLEAMLAGLPILASDAPGPDDVLCDVGIRFSGQEDLTRKLQKLFKLSLDQRSKLGDVSRERFDKEFTIESFTKKLKKLPPVLNLSRAEFPP